MKSAFRNQWPVWGALAVVGFVATFLFAAFLAFRVERVVGSRVTHAEIVWEILSDRDMIVHMVREEAARTYVEGETPEQTARRAELAGQNAASIIYGMVKNENRAEEWLALKRYGEN